MFHKSLMISGLRKQSRLLGSVHSQLMEDLSSSKPNYSFYHEQTDLIAKNLQQLREIQQSYQRALESESSRFA